VPRVRCIPAYISNEAGEALLFEATMMSQFDHPNVMGIFGVSVLEMKPCILIPLMQHGSLDKYVQRQTNVKQSNNIPCLEMSDL